MSKKQKVSQKEVKKIASLSRLSLSKEELANHTEDMNNILDYMDLLNEIDFLWMVRLRYYYSL